MDASKEIIKADPKKGLSFGNYLLKEKSKQDGFLFCGDEYKIKTFFEITKLEKNGMFVYESVPGTTVEDFTATAEEVSFTVSGEKDAQVTLELEADSEYRVDLNDESIGVMKTNVSGKLSIGVELEQDKEVKVKVRKK